jgi:(1->4)-alpha-D-glucan 1-alpha-D-glucosylmutase
MESMTGTPITVRSFVAEVRNRIGQHRAKPTATYRLEFHKDHFTFRDAAAVVPYLAALGISHVYASPCLRSFSGADHGYATVDYAHLNPALGSEEDYRSFVNALHEQGMGQILDVVPNHMSAAAAENAWWANVMEHGQSSPYAPYFDIEWTSAEADLNNRILLPMLGEQFGQALESGVLSIHYEAGRFFTSYYSQRLPLDPGTYPLILGPVLEHLSAAAILPEGRIELESILTALTHLPARTALEPELVQERQRETLVTQRRLAALTDGCSGLREAIQEMLRTINGTPDDPASFASLEGILDRQVYRLAHWKAASDEINYRRFFDVNELVAICTEHPQVFEESHRFIFELLSRGDLDGLRIDHVDGLFDPATYLWRLQWDYLLALGHQYWDQLRSEGAEFSEWPAVREALLSEFWSEIGGPDPHAVLEERKSSADLSTSQPASEAGPVSRAALPLYVVVEKILGEEEPLPKFWPVAGTTGYDFLNLVNGLFIDPEGLAKIRRGYHRFIRSDAEFTEVLQQSKRLILDVSMSSELHLLTHRLKRIAARSRHARDFTFNTLLTALRDIIVCFPVYRTYAGPAGGSPRDQQVIRRAVRQARRLNPATDRGVFDFIQSLLLREPSNHDTCAFPEECETFIGRFQQVTSPVMAKGSEDTAFYRDFPLVSINEVGGHPSHSAVSCEEFHQENLSRGGDFPDTLLCTSTHDTKRSEDVRARIDLLSEIPDVWRAVTSRWARLNRHLRRKQNGDVIPSRNDEYLLYQTLIGFWPIETPSPQQHEQLVERVVCFMEKATHEAKLHTSWISPDPEYDQGVAEFVRLALRSDSSNRFLEDLKGVIRELAPVGLLTALSQLLLKLTCPGIPDLYQGQELWDFSLVDPDNRRPIDYRCRERLLRELKDRVEKKNDLLALARSLAQTPADPRLKLFVTWRALQFRSQSRSLFETGDYVPLSVAGELAEHVCAFARTASESGSARTIVVVPRLLGGLFDLSGAETTLHSFPFDRWGQTQLVVPTALQGAYQNCFTGQRFDFTREQAALSVILADFPVGLLSSVA